MSDSKRAHEKMQEKPVLPVTEKIGCYTWKVLYIFAVDNDFL